MIVRHASKQNQAISTMHWTKSISAKNLAQHGNTREKWCLSAGWYLKASSKWKCIKSRESLNKPLQVCPGHDWCWQGWLEPRNAPPTGRCWSASCQDLVRKQFRMGLYNSFSQAARKKSLSKREVSENDFVNHIWAINLQMEALHGFAA